MSRNVNELQEDYEEEFSEFLIQEINHAGGSLQFQHLSGLLQQLRFEIRDAFGVTKSELMKFLRAHSNIFKIDSKGTVTIVNSSALHSNDCRSEEENQNVNTKKSFPEIKNGEGSIFKLFPDYAIIKGYIPVKTYLFFTPVEYGADKDSLFVDLDLSIQNKVCFNAIHGHSDYEIEYRATKVWRKFDSDDEAPDHGNLSSNKIIKTKKCVGEGCIKRLYPTIGLISVSGKGEDIFFYRSSIKDNDIKVGDRVKFTAEYLSNKWEATEIFKKIKPNINESSECSQTCTRTTDKYNVSEDKIKNELGKIYPYSNGAVIKFGKNYTELADGNLCNFYWYGIRVANADIAMEFTEGDDVKFDAIKSKNSPGWKAVSVWVGDKPVREIDKKIVLENDRITEDTYNADIDDITSEISDLVRRTKRESKNNVEVNVINEGHKLNNKNKNLNSFSKGHHKDSIEASKMFSKKISHKDSKYRQNKEKGHRNTNSNKKYNQQKSFKKKSIFSDTEEADEKLPICKDTDLDALESSETTSEENSDSPHFQRKFLKEDKQCLIEKNESYSDNESDKAISSENDKTSVKHRSSIKKFEAIDGEIIKLYCKVSIIKSDKLKKDADFVLNAFYLNGKSVEEQQVIDLKEVIKIGDVVKFNCFEIIDDDGKIHQKVTMAWKGPKPDAYEIKPEEFILEEELSVSVSDQQDDCEYEESFVTARSANFEENCDLDLKVESSQNSRLDSSHQYLGITENNIDQYSSSDVRLNRLSDRILKKLELCGFISSQQEVVLNAVQEIIDLVLKDSNIDDFLNLPQSQDGIIKSESTAVCSSCGKTCKPFVKKAINTVEAGAQTIFTGEIFSQGTW